MTYEESVEEFGVEHTHDRECQTWTGKNWVGACNCTFTA